MAEPPKPGDTHYYHYQQQSYRTAGIPQVFSLFVYIFRSSNGVRRKKYIKKEEIHRWAFLKPSGSVDNYDNDECLSIYARACARAHVYACANEIAQKRPSNRFCCFTGLVIHEQGYLDSEDRFRACVVFVLVCYRL